MHRIRPEVFENSMACFPRLLRFKSANRLDCVGGVAEREVDPAAMFSSAGKPFK